MKIGKHDAAVIISMNRVSVVVPKDDPVPDHVLFATAIAVLISEKNEEFRELVNKKINEFSEMAVNEK